MTGTAQQQERPSPRLALITLVLLGAGILLRVTGLDWDRGALLHADERYLIMILSALQWPDSIVTFFDSAASPLNPLNLGAPLGAYVYGTLPLFLAKGFCSLLAILGIADTLLASRLLAASADVATLVTVFFLGRDLFGYRVGLAAGVLYAFAVLPIQLAHFFTVDPFLNLFLCLSLLHSLRLVNSGHLRNVAWLAVFWGCALACKLSALLFAPMIAATVLVLARRNGMRLTVRRVLPALLLTLLVFRILQPYAFSGWLLPDTRFLDALAAVAALQDWENWIPPSLQWLGRGTLLFALRNMALWGLGLALFTAAFAGIVLIAFRSLRFRQAAPALLLLWLALLLLAAALVANPTLRYLLPAYPVFAVLAAKFLVALGERCARRSAGRKIPAHAPLLIVTLATLCWALAFTAIYRGPQPRIAATEWIRDNVSVDAVLGVEAWDDALPARPRNLPVMAYRQRTLEIYAPATADKREALLADLAAVDYLMVSSNRGYEALTRLPRRFPLATRYYELLFGNLAGFELAAEFAAYPHLAAVTVDDTAAEEAFTVHDHPRVLIYRKTAEFSLSRLRRQLEALTLPSDPARIDPASETIAAPVVPVTAGSLSLQSDAQWLHLLHWIVVLALAAVVGNAVADRLFPSALLPGRMLLFAPAAWVFAAGLTTGLWSAATGVLLLQIALVATALAVFWRDDGGDSIAQSGRRSGAVVFWCCFAFFLVLRWHNPAIAWGERPFDFALLNGFLRAESLPPPDPWLAGFPLQYHAWGQYLVSLMGRIAGTPPGFLYNLGAATVPALAAELIFWTVYRLTHGGGQRVWPALAGVLLVLFAGNLSFWAALPRDAFTGDFLDFWATSRIVQGTINEYPFWSAVFADLHGHFLGLVYSALFLAALVLLHCDRESRSAIGLAALALSGLMLSNPWALPVYLAVLLMWMILREERRALQEAGAVLVLAFLLTLPFWSAPADRAEISLAASPVTLREAL
ncbi:MAG: DUF2298 domain-containing protein, partial [Chromatocurvus sp.]